jgi:mercuric ion transport protein
VEEAIAGKIGGSAVGSSKLSGALSVGGILAALGASSCCVVPFALFSLGASGAWIADITALEPYQPLFVAVTLACLGGSFVLIRRKSQAACAEGSYCARPTSDRIVHVGLWTAAVLVVVAVGFPHLAPLFLPS